MATDRPLTVRAHGDTGLVMVRDFAAPRHRVFAALTEPPLLRRWLGARGWNLVTCEVDLRPGGAWRFVSEGPGGALMGHGGHYREVSPFDRLVYTESYDDRWTAGESLVTAELSGATTLTTTVAYPSREVRDHALRSPMERGVGDGYARLDAVLEELP
ncbi:SRPBCC family protein [Nonomuraea sp. NBC_01738]|uniref:SRPBCC family protein n=1 Tax=Nonomuraea sp. NBC_01738 TaxID=2976003 RepID=UPI002E1636A0|nr:SRPBCC family protein [Nonomuraea sp. NBC_01738]